MSREVFLEVWASAKRPGRFARNVFVTFATQILILLFGIVYMGLVGRGLGAERKGILELAIVLPAMMGLLLGGGVNVAIIYYAGTKQLSPQSLTAHSVSFMLCTVILSAVVMGILLAVGLLDLLLPNIPHWVTLLMLISLPFELLGIYWRAILQGSNQITAVNIVSLIKAVVLLGLTAAALVWGNWQLPGVIVAWVLTAAISLIPLAILLHRQGATFMPRWDFRVMRQMLGFGLKGYIGNLLQFFNYRLDILIVNIFVGATAVGIYSVSTRIGETLWFLPTAVGFVIMPKAASTSAKKMNKFTPVVFTITLLITLIGALFLALLGRPFINLIFGPAFISAYEPLLILLPGIVLLGGGKVLTNEITGRGYPHYNAVAAAVGLGVTIVLDIALIPIWGISGAAVASSVAYSAVFFTAAGFYVLVRRKTVREAESLPDIGENLHEIV